MSDLSLFDYAGMPVADQVEVRAAAERIRVRMKRSAEDIIAIGQDLIGVKDRLPHGAFLPWIGGEFGMSEAAAGRFMKVASVYAGKSVNLTNLTPSVLYELAAPSTPETVRQAVEVKAGLGESVSVAEVQRLKREVKDASKRADAAAADAAKLQEQNQNLLAGQKALTEQAKREAEEQAKAQLEQARADAERAKSKLNSETTRLEKAVEDARLAAERAAVDKADDLAKAAMGAAQAELDRIKADTEKARKAFDRKKTALEGLESTIQEQEAHIKRLGNRSVEANELLKICAEGTQFMALAMVSVGDTQYSHEGSVLSKVERLSQMCRQFADVLDQISRDEPDMRVIGASQ